MIFGFYFVYNSISDLELDSDLRVIRKIWNVNGCIFYIVVICKIKLCLIEFFEEDFRCYGFDYGFSSIGDFLIFG